MALNIYKKYYGEEHALYSKFLGYLSTVLKDMGDYKSAKEGFQKVLEIN